MGTRPFSFRNRIGYNRYSTKAGANVSKVDSLYQNAVDSMTPCEKIARSISLFNWSREFLWRQIQAENPNASSARIKLLVALQMYGGNARMRSMIESLLANVPD